MNKSYKSGISFHTLVFTSLILICFSSFQCASISPINKANFSQNDASIGFHNDLEATEDAILEAFNDKGTERLFSLFSPELKEKLPKSRLSNLISQIKGKAGKVLTFEKPVDTIDGYLFPIQFEKEKTDFYFNIDSLGKLTLPILIISPGKEVFSSTLAKGNIVQQDKADAFLEAFKKNFHQDKCQNLKPFLSETFAKRWPKIESGLKNAYGKYGRVVHVYPLKEKLIGYLVPIQFENSTSNLLIRFSSDGKLVDLLFLPPNISSRKITKKSTTIDDIASSYMDNPLTNGLVIGTFKHGQTSVYSYGTTQRGKTLKPDGDTVFEIGSVSKTFTATLLALTLNRLKIDLDDPIQKYMPEHVKVPSYGSKEITFKHLATHTSGFPKNPEGIKSDHEIDFNNENPFEFFSKEDLYHYLNNARLYREIGTNYDYSGIGTIIFSDILSRQSGKPFEQLLTEEILDPLSMNDTVFTTDKYEAFRLAQGYHQGVASKPWNFDLFNAAGGLKSTANDMLKYIKFHLDPQNEEFKNVIMQTHKKILPLDKSTSASFGWFIIVRLPPNLDRSVPI